MSSKRRKQNKPVKSALVEENMGSLGANQPTTRSRRRAALAKRQKKGSPEPTTPLRRSTRKRKKKEFFYPSKPPRATPSPTKRLKKGKVLDSESFSDVSDEISEDTPPTTPTPVGHSNGLALLAEVTHADQALLGEETSPDAAHSKHAPSGGSVMTSGRKRAPPRASLGNRNYAPGKRQAQKTVLDVDVLRKIPIAKLISQFSIYSSMKVPKDAFSSSIRHTYACTMLPGICNEKFCGLLVDTKNQIKRHLLRHIGELLTMTTQNNPTDSKHKKVETVSTSEEKLRTEDSPKGDSDKDSDMVTYAIPSGTRHVTVNLPRSLDIKESDYTLIRSSAGANEVVLLPKGCLVSLASVMEELKPHQFGKRSRKRINQGWYENEEVEILSVSDDRDDVIDNESEEILVEDFLKDTIQDEEYFLPDVVENVMIVDEEIDIIAPESQTVECDIEIRTKRKKYTKKYDLPREVGKCQKFIERPNSKQQSSQNVDAVEPPHADHNYSVSICNPQNDTQTTDALHTNATGQPISEPDASDNEMVNFSFDSMNAQSERPRKAKTQNTKMRYKVKQEPKPLTEEEKKNKKKALELLGVLSKKSRDRKGPFTCEICGKKVTATGTLRAHYRSHAGIKPFECSHCSATFTRLHSLKYHLMIHNEQTRFVCDHCGREFRHSSHFREHLRRHTGEEPFGCTDCPLRFKTRNSYKRHLRAKHQKKLTAKGISLIVKKD